MSETRPGIALPARVLLVQPSPIRGGAEESLLELLTRANPERVTFTVACLADGPYVDDLEAAGAEVVRLRAGRLRYPHRWAATVLRLARLARVHDVVLGWQVKANYYGTPAARIAGRPAAWWDHGIRPARGEKRWLVDNVLPAGTRADAVFGSSSASASRHRRGRTILPGIPVDTYAAGDRTSARNALGVRTGAIVLGTVGRLQPWKGQHVLIEALPAIRKRHPSAEVCVVGDALGGFSEGYPAELRDLADDLGVEDAVHFLGHRDDVAALLPGFDRFVMCSLGEPFGLVTVEAMAAGVPVIATAAGGTLEILTDGVDGILVPPGDPEALAAAVVASLDDPEGARALASAAQAKALRDFDIRRYVHQIEDAMIELAGGTR